MNIFNFCRDRLAQWLSVRFVNLYVRGPRFESRRRILSFQTRFNREAQFMFGGTSNYRRDNQPRNLSEKKLLQPLY